MSIVAYYARMSVEQLSACVAEPQKLESGSVTDLPGAQVIDVDRSWEPMAWLVSPRKRIEQEHNALVMSEMMSETRPTPPSRGSLIVNIFRKQPKQKPQEPSAAIKESLRRTDETPLDLPLVAIEGRTEGREESLNFGMGGAAIFSPEQVTALHTAIAAITPQTIDQQYQPELMDQMGVFPEHWVEEGRDLIDNYIIPNFKKLQTFYSMAAQSGQTVIVWYM